MGSLPVGNDVYSEKVNKRILIFGIFVFCFLVVARDIMHIAYSKYLLVAFSGVVATFLNYSNLISFISFMIPLSCGIPGNYIFMVLAVLYVVKKPNLSKYHLFFAFVFIIQEIALSFLSANSDIVELAAYCIKLFLTFGIIFDEKDNNAREHLIAFIIGATFLLVMILGITAQLVEFDVIINDYEFRLGETKVAGMSALQFGTNANTIGFYSLLTVSVCLILIKLTKGLKWFYIPTIAINIFIGLLSVSRTYIVFLAVIIVLFILISAGFKPSGKSILTLLAIIFLLGILVSYLSENTAIFESYEMRFDDSTAKSAGGRSDIMKRYFEWQTSNPFYLIFGASALNHVTLSGFGSPHNALQQLMVSYGFIGFIVMIIALVYAVVLLKKEKKIPKVAYIPFIAIIVFLQTLQLLYPTEYFMSLIYGYMSLKLANDYIDVDALQ